MSTVTTPNNTIEKELPPGRYSFLDLVKSEWTKIRTVRSTMWTVGITILLGVGIGALVCAVTQSHWATTQHFQFDAPATSLVGLFIAQFSVGILGVLMISAEYSTGTIRATFSAAPNRSRVFAAKVAVFGLLSFVVAEFTSFVSFFLGQALLSAPATHATLSSPGAFRAVFGGGLYICLLGLIALGLGTIIRHTAGAISAFVGILLIIPIIVQTLPYQLSFDIRRFLPDHIGVSILTTQGREFGAFSPWTGALILALYALGLLVIGNSLINRRDA